MNKKISIVTPTFNEESNIEALCLGVSEQMKKLSYDYEHIIIDNSSDDKTVQILRKLIEKDNKIKVIVNEKKLWTHKIAGSCYFSSLGRCRYPNDG